MRLLVRSLTGLFLLAVTVALLAVAGATVRSALIARNAEDGRGRPASERTFSARVVTLEPGPITPVLTAYGQVESRRRLELRAAAAGPITELAPEFADGTAVRQGQLLVRIDPADAKSALDLARNGLAEAEAEREDAERALKLAADDLAAAEVQGALRQQALERQRDIATRGLGTAADLETAELAMSSATQGIVSRRQALATAEARAARADTAMERQRLAVADAERRLAETELRASFDGVLSGVVAVAGGLASKNEKLGELIDPAALEVSFRVSTAQFGRLIDETGGLLPLPVTASLDVLGLGLEAGGVMSRVDAAVGAGSSGRLLFATLGAAPGFRPGDFVTLRIDEPALDGVAMVPATAVGADGMVLAVGPDDRLEAVTADVLRRQGDDVILKVGALAGREIVSERTALLGPGIRIKPIREGGVAAAEDQAMIDLTPERRAALIAFVEASEAMPTEAKARVLAQLRDGPVPADVVSRIEARMGG
ncbi:MAG: efflux transporter periplasmic adaptor subunit [Paracoccaceae bacterium]